MATAALQAERVEIPDDIWEAQEYFVEKGWSDGLPVIPPSEDRVAKMLAGTKRKPDEVIGSVPPRWAQATVEKIAINGVMAGCKPEYMPVLIAATEALCDPKLNLYALQATTGGPAVMLIINGPVRRSGRACHRDLKRGRSRAGRDATHELGPTAQTGLRYRRGTLPQLRQRLEDHRRHRRSAGNHQDPQPSGPADPRAAPAPARRVDLFQTI